MKEPRRKQIVIAESEHGLPYSKGLTASSLMMTGLGPARSYQVANKIEQEMGARGLEQVSQEQLVDITLEVLRREAGDQYAEAFIKWQSVAELDIPLIILIGGATGVGKSTVATQLASRLGITRVVSTDAVREILRSAFTPEMFPTLYSSSFEADKAVRQPIPHSGDRLIIGFREQAAAVAVGAQSLISRAIAEGTDLILEGAHLVPGFIESLDEIDNDRAVVVSVVISVDDEKLHRSHFFRRQYRHPTQERAALSRKLQEDQKDSEIHGDISNDARGAGHLALRPRPDSVRDYRSCRRSGVEVGRGQQIRDRGRSGRRDAESCRRRHRPRERRERFS